MGIHGDLDMRQVAFVNASQVTDGTFRTSFQVFESRADAGFQATWYQCRDIGARREYYRGGQNIDGIRWAHPAIAQGINRLWKFPQKLRLVDADTFYLSDPTLVRVGTGSRAARTWVSIADLRPLGPFGDRRTTQWMFRYAVPKLRRMHGLVTPSIFSRNQLGAVIGTTDRIQVLAPHVEVPVEIGAQHLSEAVDRIALKEVVNVLYIATDRPYKNIPFFARLAKSLSRMTRPNYRFRLVARLSSRTAAELAALQVENLEVIPFAPNLGDVYHTADVLAFPSLYEGFGLPMLDAMSYGIPVLANDAEPMREILGESGIFKPANNLESWMDGIIALGDRNAYGFQGRKSLDRSANYSHQRFVQTVRQLLA